MIYLNPSENAQEYNLYLVIPGLFAALLGVVAYILIFVDHDENQSLFGVALLIVLLINIGSGTYIRNKGDKIKGIINLNKNHQRILKIIYFVLLLNLIGTILLHLFKVVSINLVMASLILFFGISTSFTLLFGFKIKKWGKYLIKKLR